MDPVLYAFDGDQQLLAVDDNGGGGVNSLIRLNVAEGQTYFLLASSHAGTSGPDQLDLDYGPTFDRSEFLALTGLVSSGNTKETGTLTAPGDVNAYSFTAPFTGSITLQAAASAGSTLAPVLYAFDAPRISSDVPARAEPPQGKWPWTSSRERPTSCG